MKLIEVCRKKNTKYSCLIYFKKTVQDKNSIFIKNLNTLFPNEMNNYITDI